MTIGSASNLDSSTWTTYTSTFKFDISKVMERSTLLADFSEQYLDLISGEYSTANSVEEE